MKNLNNVEIINLSIVDGKLVAIVSYYDPEVKDLNNGYNIVEIPVNIRELQKSVRGNVLVDQSVKGPELNAVNLL